MESINPHDLLQEFLSVRQDTLNLVSTLEIEDFVPQIKGKQNIPFFFGAWEWTTSDYHPYPGFQTDFKEYNDKWFINQKVLRGGSYGTRRDHFRPTYRNFFYPQDRWVATGFRCARTIL